MFPCFAITVASESLPDWGKNLGGVLFTLERRTRCVSSPSIVRKRLAILSRWWRWCAGALSEMCTPWTGDDNHSDIVWKRECIHCNMMHCVERIGTHPSSYPECDKVQYRSSYCHIFIQQHKWSMSIEETKVFMFAALFTESQFWIQISTKSMAKKRGLSADEKKKKMLDAMLAGVDLSVWGLRAEIGIQHQGAGEDW